MADSSENPVETDKIKTNKMMKIIVFMIIFLSVLPRIQFFIYELYLQPDFLSSDLVHQIIFL
ncbi:MAG: hypothetical protein A2161_08590 [Candidatus Schekmanbacteria bacterium RBG_13_48_7]|uniref:Uncharacterized protein n=1 Tax=Candidatus Schekmanbacteria bacterium RBG_13_48_7 TaxID=1817878 RepID=A0A1F7RXV5_9BACT|nr:MAG: hypothetical protein A2161_08590 [Candidatus Schekmanbacteria bacterium RBG_13_48_7]